MRVLITGSRDWTDVPRIRGALDRLSRGYPRESFTLVSGACPTGADRICEDIAMEKGWEIEHHPADWVTHGRRAGFLRNAEMVDLGADIVLAFIKNNSRGATMTADLAEKQALFVRRYIEEG